ncbi:MAG: hypothetical protein LBS16_01065 [Prevotellaceae bacterium]|nr:hypothetical protein [Prevotellaceae bacterium]
MNKIMKSKLLLILSLIFVLCCTNNKTKNISREQQSNIPESIDKMENFEFFIEKFRDDSIFQKSRLAISNAYIIKQSNDIDSALCKGNTLMWSEFDEICYDIITIRADNWRIIKSDLLLEKNEEDWFAKFDTIDINTIKYVAGWNNASEVWYQILFERQSGKWYLVQFIDYDNVLKW